MRKPSIAWWMRFNWVSGTIMERKKMKMRKLLIALVVLASLLLGTSVSVAIAQDGASSSDNPLNITIDISDAVKVDLGFNDATPAMFVSPKMDENATMAIGGLVDIATLRFVETGEEGFVLALLKGTDPALGAGYYHDDQGDTHAGPVLTIKMSYPIEWLVTEFTGWEVLGDKIDVRVGAAYTGELELVFTAGIKVLEF